MDTNLQQQDSTQAPQPGADQPGAQPGGSSQGRGAEAYRRIVMGAMQAVYGKGSSDGLLNMIKSAEDPVTGVAQATVAVLAGLKQQIKGINPNFVYTAASAVAGMLFELGDAAGLLKFDQTMMQDVLKALPQVLQQFGESGGGQPTPDAQEAPQAAPQGAPATAPQGLIGSAMGA